MTTFFKDGIISKDGKNMGVKVPPVGTNAPGQNVASGNVPGFVFKGIWEVELNCENRPGGMREAIEYGGLACEPRPC